jgi:hypothetical protein
MAFEVNLAQAKQMVIDCLFAKLVPMVVGSPGMGKSAMLHSVAEELNLKVIDLRLAQCDPTDLLGFPGVDEKTGKATYRPMDTFPLQGDTVPEGYDGWLLLLDEMNGADKDVQKACYKTIYDQMVGNVPLHERCVIAAAGNLDTDNAIVEELSTALQSRMIHMQVSIDNAQWLDWSSEAGIDFRVRSYIRFKPDNLFNFNPDHDDKTFACPRTWQFVSKLIQGKEKLSYTDKALLAGTVGEGVGRTFAGYCEIIDLLPTIDTITRSPDTVRVPIEPSVQWATAGMMGAYMEDTNASNLMKYVVRLPKEFQIFALRDVIRRNEKMLEHDALAQWITNNSTELF